MGEGENVLIKTSPSLPSLPSSTLVFAQQPVVSELSLTNSRRRAILPDKACGVL